MQETDKYFVITFTLTLHFFNLFLWKKLFLLSTHTPRSFLFQRFNPSPLPLMLRGNRFYQG